MKRYFLLLGLCVLLGAGCSSSNGSSTQQVMVSTQHVTYETFTKAAFDQAKKDGIASYILLASDSTLTGQAQETTNESVFKAYDKPVRAFWVRLQNQNVSADETQFATDMNVDAAMTNVFYNKTGVEVMRVTGSLDEAELKLQLDQAQR